MKKNKGYTLIEFIIVLAIMAVLTGVAFVSLTIIQKAKCTSAANLFNNQLSTLWVQTKSLSQAKMQTAPSGSDDAQKYPMCMLIQKDGEAFQLYYGFDTGTDVSIKPNSDVEAENLSTKNLPTIIDVQYIPNDITKEHEKTINSNCDKIVVEFNKSDGSVKYGAGTYNLIHNGRVVASIYLDSVTGKHYIK